ncbi:MAG: hypothetical protein IIW36_02860 [Clostridia bacterium]|jgi:hypothetical protein|nr:hypothetical protein [Clostridia bacterium]
MKLSKNEVVIKSFDYAKSARGANISKNSLTVTNKRIVHQTRSAYSVTRQEIPVGDARYLNTAFSRKRNPAYMVFAILFLALGIVGTLLLAFLPKMEWEGTATRPTLLPIAVGGALFLILILLYALVTKNVLALSIGGDVHKQELLSFLSIGKLPVDKRGRKKEAAIYVYVSRKKAMELINELGAILLDLQEPAVTEEKILPQTSEEELVTEEAVEEAVEEASEEAAEEAVEEPSEEAEA